MEKFIPDTQIQQVFVQGFRNGTLIPPCPSVPNHTYTLGFFCLEERGCRSPTLSLIQNVTLWGSWSCACSGQESVGAWALRRFDDSQFNFFLLCASFYLPLLGPEPWVRVTLMVPGKPLPRAFSQKADQLKTHLLGWIFTPTHWNFRVPDGWPDYPSHTAGPFLVFAIFPLAHQCGSSGVPIDSNWMGALSNMLFLEDGRWGGEDGKEGEEITKDLFMDKLWGRLPPPF